MHNNKTMSSRHDVLSLICIKRSGQCKKQYSYLMFIYCYFGDTSGLVQDTLADTSVLENG